MLITKQVPLQPWTEVSLCQEWNTEYASLIQSNFYSVDFILEAEELRTTSKVKFSIFVYTQSFRIFKLILKIVSPVSRKIS